MNLKPLRSVAIIGCIAMGQLASAQGNGPEGYGRNQQRQQQTYGQGDRQDRPHPGGRMNNDRREIRGMNGYGYEYGRDRGPGQRGAGPDHNFYRGERLSYPYRHSSYVVEDWRGHHLSAPPRGYHWVQTGSDYVLVAIASGLILQILLSQ